MSDPLSDYDIDIVGPEDILVLVSKGHVSQGDLAHMRKAIPERLHGRFVVVDGTTVSPVIMRDVRAP